MIITTDLHGRGGEKYMEIMILHDKIQELGEQLEKIDYKIKRISENVSHDNINELQNMLRKKGELQFAINKIYDLIYEIKYERGEK